MNKTITISASNHLNEDLADVLMEFLDRDEITGKAWEEVGRIYGLTREQISTVIEDINHVQHVRIADAVSSIQIRELTRHTIKALNHINGMG